MKQFRVFSYIALWCASILAAPFIANSAVAAKMSLSVFPNTEKAERLQNTNTIAGSFTLVNQGPEAVTVTSVSSSDYKQASFKQNIKNADGTVKTENVDNLNIPEQSSLALNTEGYYILLEQPKHRYHYIAHHGIEVTLHLSTGHKLKIKLPAGDLQKPQ
jgi:copper(I)-binding protein